MDDQYKIVSKIYNKLSHVYSLGAIPKCRVAGLSGELLDTTICFIGVGHGDEAIHAARNGARVTVVDLSASMLDKFKQKMTLRASEFKHTIRIVQDDVMAFLKDSEESFDKVVANFFLNVFPLSELETIVSLVMANLKQDGELIVGDFYLSRDKGGLTGVFQRSFQRVNWYLALLLFRLMTANTWHGIYHYDAVMTGLGMKLEKRKLFRVLGIPMYQSSSYKKSHPAG